MTGEVSLKERLVDGDVLYPDDPLLLFDLENPVHQQERVAVGQNLHDVFYRIHPLLLSSGLHHLPYQRHRSAMTRFHRHNSGANARPGQRQVADAIHRLVPHELVSPPQIAAQNVTVVEHDRVVE